MLRTKSAAMVGVMLLVAGCSSPADVEQLHQQEMAKYQGTLASAQEWNTHTFGIPASGWLAIIITSIVMGFILLILIGCWVYNTQDRRAEDRMITRKLDAEVRRAIAGKPTCGMCGYTLTPASVADAALTMKGKNDV